MKTLAIDRSTENTSAVLADGDGAIEHLEMGIWNAASPLNLPDARDIGRIVVGTGPGSFAGIRSALAFAQGMAVGGGCEVLGLMSAAAFARKDDAVAVVGDARRGKFWIALFEGYRLAGEIFQVEREALAKRVPRTVPVVSPDWRRIGDVLAEEFGGNAAAAPSMDAAKLLEAAQANPALLTAEPLPIYLNPAVR